MKNIMTTNRSNYEHVWVYSSDINFDFKIPKDCFSSHKYEKINDDQYLVWLDIEDENGNVTCTKLPVIIHEEFIKFWCHCCNVETLDSEDDKCQDCLEFCTDNEECQCN